ncbi:MAG: hypothetical protein OEW64_12800 [Gammaproteobacteria bacterium]|nr:hypothetical protein [Gammaproteobacteria bacterium]MDH5304961.1 hypothetical protein [Gammaproteobacteria bacterium]MDH5322013.1 hypothetical protein [Gammaproteobacteria bacterium]
MKTIVVAFLICQSFSVWATECPVTIGIDGPYVEGWPNAKTWYGSEKIAVILPADGIWPTTKPGNLTSVKLFWYLEGFKPGLENEFEFSIQRIDEGPNDAVAPRVTNAGGPNLGAWTALVGIDFPNEGCWEIAGSFRGNTLTFVVKTEISAYGRGNAA